jgi:eukaryotic-like serine/threonine-protein kinase
VTAKRWQTAKALLDEALDRAPADRASFLDQACGADAALRAEVESLVAASQRTGGFLEPPSSVPAGPLDAGPHIVDVLAPAHDAGRNTDLSRIGLYRIVRVLGQGGMGTVYEAEQLAPLHRTVALKVIRRGMDTDEVLARFESERQALAVMDHPNIAKALDAGTTEDGLPYFVMELVAGVPITDYCDSHQLDIRGRLELFTAVCKGVQHAHQKGVIHRDLKPSNILVRLVDGKPVPTIIDFGIAKAVERQLSDAAFTTELGIVVGTPAYMSPEQAKATGLDIDTRADIYSLGMVLYELVTGVLPFDLSGLLPGPFIAQYLLARADVPRPSQRVARLAVDTATAVAQRRHTTRVGLRRELRGDIDWIVLKGIDWDRTRRYETANGLALDLERYLEHKPIAARPPTFGYTAAKFVGRHRLGVGLTASLVVVLAVASGREMVLRGRAEVEASKAREVEEFLVGVFNVADPHEWELGSGGSVTARELLDRGVRRIDSSLGGQPEVQAELRGVLGRVYSRLGLYNQATPLLREALAQRTALHGVSDSGVAATQDLLGTTLTELNQYEEAEPLLRGALAQRRRLLGHRHLATAESLEHLGTLLEERNEYDQAEQAYREALAIRRSLAGDSAVEVAVAIGNLGLLLHRKGAYAEAESLHQSALDVQLRVLGEDHPITAATMQNLAQTLGTRGRLEEAVAYHRRALEVKRRALGDAHPSVTISMNNLATLLSRRLGRLDEGEALARQALAGDRKTFGEEHSYVAASLANLGVVLRLQGRLAEADSLLRRALAINRKVFGEHHERIASNLGSLGQTRSLMGDGNGALGYMRQSVAEYRQVLGDDHRNTVATVGSLALVLAEYGDPLEAESLARVSLAKLDSKRPEHRLYWINAQLALGKALVAQRRSSEALPLLARLVETAEEQFGKGNPQTGDAMLTYGAALAAERRYVEAGPMLRAAAAVLEENQSAQPRLAMRAKAALDRLPK